TSLIGVLHLVADAGDLRRLPREKRGTRSGTHGRGDVVIAEGDAVAHEGLASRQLVIVASGELVRLLIADHEDDVAWRRFRGQRARRLSARRLCRWLCCGAAPGCNWISLGQGPALVHLVAAGRFDAAARLGRREQLAWAGFGERAQAARCSQVA